MYAEHVNQLIGHLFMKSSFAKRGNFVWPFSMTHISRNISHNTSVSKTIDNCTIFLIIDKCNGEMIYKNNKCAIIG